LAVKIRLMRVGKKKQPSYRVVVSDARSPRDGRFIEVLGQYAPRAEPSVVTIDADRALHWLRVGAQPTEQVGKLLEITGVWAAYKTAVGKDAAVKPKAKTPKAKKVVEPPAPAASAERPAEEPAPGVDVIAPELKRDQKLLAVLRHAAGHRHAETDFDRLGGVNACVSEKQRSRSKERGCDGRAPRAPGACLRQACRHEILPIWRRRFGSKRSAR